MRKSLVYLLFLCSIFPTFANGSYEAAGQSGNVGYEARLGNIVPPDQIMVEAYIASMNYLYPMPEEEFGIFLYPGRRQLATPGREEFLQIGVQASRMEFRDLPPLNLAFVIDRSGSMSGQDKMEWVHDAFDIFIDNVRDGDFVSIVAFDDQAELHFPSTEIRGQEMRQELRELVRGITPDGGTNLTLGLEAGYEQVMANYRSDYTNRVLFLTDGVGESGGMLEMAETYNGMGVNVSTIGVGTGFDATLMVDLAISGGGSSRFIKDREEMEKIFGSEMDRMVAANSRNLELIVEFQVPVEILDTWGYDYVIEGSSVRYLIPTLHNRDYETMVLRYRLLEELSQGEYPIVDITCRYQLPGEDPSTYQKNQSLSLVWNGDQGLSEYSNGMALASGSMMEFGLAMMEIGQLAHSLDQGESGDENYSQALVIAQRQKALLENRALRLDSVDFTEEIEIMDHYIATLSSALGEDVEIPENDTVEEITELDLINRTQGMMMELYLECQELQGSLAISGFTTRDDQLNGFTQWLNEASINEMTGLENLNVVERDRLDLILQEQQMSLSALVDTTTAVRVGELLSAQYILTGTVLPMSRSQVVFARIIEVESGRVITAVQSIFPMDQDLTSLIGE